MAERCSISCQNVRKYQIGAESVSSGVRMQYSPEVETEKPFKRKRKENDLDGKVLCVF